MAYGLSICFSTLVAIICNYWDIPYMFPMIFLLSFPSCFPSMSIMFHNVCTIIPNIPIIFFTSYSHPRASFSHPFPFIFSTCSHHVPISFPITYSQKNMPEVRYFEVTPGWMRVIRRCQSWRCPAGDLAEIGWTPTHGDI